MTIISLFVGAFLTKRRELYLKLAEQKVKHYSALFDALYAPSLDDRLYVYRKTNIVLHGSRKVIEKLAICEKNGISVIEDEKKNELFELIYEMKKDIERPKLLLSLFNRTCHKKVLKRDIKNILFDYKKRDENA